MVIVAEMGWGEIFGSKRGAKDLTQRKAEGTESVGQEDWVEERSFVAEGAPLDDGQRRFGWQDQAARRRGSFGATLANGIRSRSSLRFGMTCFFLVGKSIELAVTKLGRGAVALGGVG